MLCKDIIRVIEDTYPKHAALEWDHVGLQIGRTQKEVKKIYVALEVTDEVIEDAIAKQVDMLVTHHPLLFAPLEQITDEDFIGGRVVKLLQHDISYYAMHTNYDVLGMADLAGNMLGLKDMEVFEENGIGRIGFLPKEMSVKDAASYVKEAFDLATVKVYGDLDMMISKVAISPGSGKGMSGVALEKGVEALITGDIGHHEGIDGMSQGLCIIDAGHYGTEYIFIDDMANFLKGKLDGIDVIKADVVHPFQVI